MAAVWAPCCCETGIARREAGSRVAVLALQINPLHILKCVDATGWRSRVAARPHDFARVFSVVCAAVILIVTRIAFLFLGQACATKAGGLRVGHRRGMKKGGRWKRYSATTQQSTFHRYAFLLVSCAPLHGTPYVLTYRAILFVPLILGRTDALLQRPSWWLGLRYPTHKSCSVAICRWHCKVNSAMHALTHGYKPYMRVSDPGSNSS